MHIMYYKYTITLWLYYKYFVTLLPTSLKLGGTHWMEVVHACTLLYCACASMHLVELGNKKLCVVTFTHILLGNKKKLYFKGERKVLVLWCAPSK